MVWPASETNRCGIAYVSAKVTGLRRYARPAIRAACLRLSPLTQVAVPLFCMMTSLSGRSTSLLLYCALLGFITQRTGLGFRREQGGLSRGAMSFRGRRVRPGFVRSRYTRAIAGEFPPCEFLIGA